MTITLTQLEYIVAVDRLKSFSKAAEACHISQPSLSMQIQKVEDILGYLIFDRTKKPTQTTEKGERFVGQAKNVLREHEHLLQMTKADAQGVSGAFKLGIIPTLTPYLLPLFITPFAKNFPQVRLIVDEMKTEDIIEKLKSNDVDGGILATPLNEESLIETPVFWEPFQVYLSPGHILAKKTKIHEHDLKSHDLWLLKDGHCLRNQVINYCNLERQEGPFKNVTFEGGNLETLRLLIKQSQGYTLLPQLFIDTLSSAEQKVNVRPLSNPVPLREISFVRHRSQWKLDICNAIIESLKLAVPVNLTKPPHRNTQVLAISTPIESIE